MARTRKINAAELFEPVEIDLWGTKFGLREATRSIEASLAEKMEAMKNLDVDEDASEAEQLEKSLPILLDMIDVMLEPLGDEDGKKSHAKTVLKKLYDDDKIGVSHIEALVNRLKEVAMEARPT